GIQSLGSVGVNAAVILGEKRLERVSLFVLVCLPGRFFQISDRALTCSRFRRLRLAFLSQANWSSRNYGDTTESECLFHSFSLFDCWIFVESFLIADLYFQGPQLCCGSRFSLSLLTA